MAPRHPTAARTVCLLLALACFAAYWQVRQHGFVNLDEDLTVYENPHIRGGLTWAGVRWAFTADLLFQTPHATYWYPLTVLSRMVDVELFGVNPAGHHAVNVLLHAANAVMLFVLLMNLSGLFWESAFVAAVFALHPVHVESVAWLAERKDVLCAFFWFLTMLAYASYCRRRSRRRYGLVVGACACALMAKPMAVTLPFVLLLLDLWPLGRIKPKMPGGREEWAEVWQPVREKLPLLSMSLACGLVTVRAQWAGGAMSGLGALPFSRRVANALLSYTAYIGKIFWPRDLAVIYPLRESISAWAVAGSLVLLGGLTCVALLLVKRAPCVAVGWLWYIGVLAPVSGVAQAGVQCMADRFVYIPAVGIYIAVTMGLAQLMMPHRRWRPLVALGASVVLAALFVCTWRQLRFWRNGEALFTRSLAVAEASFIAHTNLGVELAKQGRINEAIGHYRRALALNPTYDIAHVSLGAALREIGDVDGALRHYRDALAVSPNNAAAHVNLGDILRRRGELDTAHEHLRAALTINPYNAVGHVRLGAVYLEKGDTAQAMAHFRTALTLDPGSPAVHMNLGTVWLEKGNVGAAVDALKRAVSLKPDFVAAHFNLGNALRQKGDADAAIRQYRRALKLRPQHVEAMTNLGASLMAKGDHDQAVECFEAALRTKPDLFSARINLAQALQFVGSLEESARNYELALQSRPDLADAHNDLGGVYARLGKLSLAERHCATALELEPDLPEAHVNLADILRRQGKADQAAHHLSEAVRLRPDWPLPLSRLAWLYATSPDDAVRNAGEAVGHAGRLCELLGRDDVNALDVLAAAYAAARRFDDAVRTAARALELAGAEHGNRQQIEQRLSLYRAGRPYVERIEYR